MSELDLTDLYYGNGSDTSDYYYVSNYSGVVYYLKGVSIWGTTYYRVTSPLYTDIARDIATGKNDIVRYECVFSLSTREQTSNAVTVQVRLPRACTFTSVTATNIVGADGNGTAVSVSSTSTTPQYQYRNVNTGNVTGNYVVIVEYVGTDGNTRTVRYTVSNYNSNAPTI